MDIDFVYLMETDEERSDIKVDGVAEAKWMTKEEVLNCDTFDSVRAIVSKILNS
jgi:isopentenyldiphosphate isomerase